jgi:hypothetical protein
MKTGKHSIQSGEQFNHLFQTPKGEFIDIMKFPELSDTVSLIKEVILKTKGDTKALAQTLKRSTPIETLRAVWNFTFDHIQYEPDEQRVEQVRRPARTWRDRKNGVDCDCLTVFIGSILTNLEIPFLIRVTKYKVQNNFEHVYPVALIGNQPIIMDCVVHQFNYEEPYITKKDEEMKLQYLNGFEQYDEDSRASELMNGNDIPEDAEAFYLMDDLEGLEGKAQREARKEKRQEKRENKPPLKERLKKGLNVINKINPVTALLRAGVLASMKLNVGKVAGKLRYSYWDQTKATANNMEPGKYQQLVQVRQKLEKIFYGAGGNPENLRKSILEGRGNRDKRVLLNGLGSINQPITDYSDIESIIGSDVFFEEFDGVQGGINGLGEIASATAIASASGVLATIAAFIKKIGPLFKKGSPEEQKEILADNTADATPIIPTDSTRATVDDLTPLPITANNLTIPQGTFPTVPTATNELDESELDEDGEPSANARSAPAPDKPKTESGGFGQWIKDNPALSAGIALGVGVVLYKLYQKSQEKKQKQALSGLPPKSKTTQQKTKSAKGGITKVKLM